MATVAGGDQPLAQPLREYSAPAQALRVGNYLGIARKAGQVAAGDLATEQALKAGRAYLLVLAQDISAAAAKELLYMAQKQRVPLLWWPDKISLGLLVGKSQRGALAVLDPGFTAAILKLCEEGNHTI